MSEKAGNTKDADVYKAGSAANIPAEFKTGQIMGNPSRVSGGTGETDDRGLAAVGKTRLGQFSQRKALTEPVTQSWGQHQSPG